MDTLKKISTLLLLLSTFLSFSQQPFKEISGIVVDEKKHPIEFANVFVNNTSIGTTTNSKGEFSLTIPNNIPSVELIVSFVGFEKYKGNISLSNEEKKKMNFVLKTILIQEVRVMAKRDKNYKRNWEIFKKIILGQSDFTKDCEILNADNLRFEEDSDGSLLITAPEPFYILNKALSYKIRVEMPFFKHNEKKWTGIIDEFFEKITPTDSLQENLWKKNRIIAFKDSFRNFLVSIANDKILENNFSAFQRKITVQTYSDLGTISKEIKEEKLSPLKTSDFYFFDNQRGVHTLFSNKDIIVFLKDKREQEPIFAEYPYKFASLVLAQKSMSFNENGWIVKPNGFVLGGEWSQEGLSVSLPNDFVLE